MNEQNQKEKIPLTTFQKLLEAVCLLLTIGITFWLIFIWNTIPHEIPTHFNLAGEADGWGSKAELLILPILQFFLYLFITILSRFPQIWNHPWTVTPENRLYIYQNLYSMILFCKLALVCTFSYLIFVSSSQSNSLSGWFSFFSLGGTLLPICFFLIKISKGLKQISNK